jgi:hypothetical protein
VGPIIAIFLFVAGAALLVSGHALSQMAAPLCPDCEGSGGPTYVAVAQCLRTGSVGTGSALTQQEAVRAAMIDCENRARVPGCCRIIDVRVQR